MTAMTTTEVGNLEKEEGEVVLAMEVVVRKTIPGEVATAVVEEIKQKTRKMMEKENDRARAPEKNGCRRVVERAGAAVVKRVGAAVEKEVEVAKTEAAREMA